MWRDQLRRHQGLHLHATLNGIAAWMDCFDDDDGGRTRASSSPAQMVAALRLELGLLTADGGGADGTNAPPLPVDAALECLHQLCWQRCINQLPGGQRRSSRGSALGPADTAVVSKVARGLQGEALRSMDAARLAFFLR